ILLWLKLKWIDYVVPQLYWEFGQKSVGFEVLIDWWAKHAYRRQLYIGLGIYRSMEPRSYAWKNRNELPNQIKKLREYPLVQLRRQEELTRRLQEKLAQVGKRRVKTQNI